MNLIDLIVFLIVGGIAGWLASVLMKGRGMGIVWNIILGILGAFVGPFVVGMLGITITWSLGYIVQATVGAIIVLVLARVLVK